MNRMVEFYGEGIALPVTFSKLVNLPWLELVLFKDRTYRPRANRGVQLWAELYKGPKWAWRCNWRKRSASVFLAAILFMRGTTFPSWRRCSVEKLARMTPEKENRRLSLNHPAGCRNSFSSCNDGKATSDFPNDRRQHFLAALG